VPIKDSILLYVAPSIERACDYSSPYRNDFVERSGAAGMLHMWDTKVYGKSGHTWFAGSNLNHPSSINKLAPSKTLEYHRTMNLPGPEPKLITKLTKPFGLIYSHEKAVLGQEALGGLTMRRELEAGMRVDLFWPGTGPIVPEERLALKELFAPNIGASNVTGEFDFFPSSATQWPFGSGGGLSIAEFLADDTVDPCLHRLDETMCVGGHIVSLGSAVPMHRQRLPCNAFELMAKFTKLSRLEKINDCANPAFALTCAPGGVERALVPCSFWQLSELVSMNWNFEPRGMGVEMYADPTPYHFEACPDTIGSMPNLLHAEFNTPGATGKPPTRVLQSPNLEVMIIEHLALGDLPSLEQVPNLKTLMLTNNNISGVFPSLSNKERLEKVTIKTNQFKNAAGVGTTARSFDNCTKLSSVTITDTDITELFRFAGSTKLISIDLSHNRIDTAMPESWFLLNATETVDLSHNCISQINSNWNVALEKYEKLTPMKGMTSIKSVNWAHNEIADIVPGGMSNFMLNLFTYDALDMSIGIQHVDLSHNKLSTTGPAAAIGLGTNGGHVKSMLSFAFDHNNLGGFFDLWESDSCKINQDGSYNKMSAIRFGTNAGGCSGKHAALMRIDISNQLSNLTRFIAYAIEPQFIRPTGPTLDLMLEGTLLTETPFVPSATAPFGPA
jgi:Leucine-rich repeat (LRR) protein